MLDLEAIRNRRIVEFSDVDDLCDEVERLRAALYSVRGAARLAATEERLGELVTELLQTINAALDP